ncbi:MAG: cupin domain-containing protein [Desulfobacterales bacterium]|nr:cupin domain-containing protein [Desulfobacterales bacterium]MDJ0886404.1 cupin domain-containing protein [Desulfobacterales bacterium]MDJ0990214.1 cupin domain-containing protein [Desulfobacterales bacterium]
MEVKNYKDCEEKSIEKFPFKGTPRDVVGTSIRWLSSCGDDGTGYPEYGLRYFTIQPGGRIPIHNHFYHQTMYILSGRFECWQFDTESETVVQSAEVGPGDFVYVPSMEAHGMRNLSDTAPGSFLCCICNVYADQDHD